MIVTTDTRMLPITDHSCIADARRKVGHLAAQLGFDDTRRGQAEIITTELATNIHLHAGNGYLLVRTQGLDAGIELIAVDRGRGMANPQECLRDGFSTAGTAGNGLGAIRRLAHIFDLHTQVDAGTVVLAQIHRGVTIAMPRFVVGALSIALAGESACGDAWTAVEPARGLRVAMADGLGHGSEAAQAAQAAMRVVAASRLLPPGEVLRQAHGAIAATRGAAMAVCDIDPGDGAVEGSVRFAGVGNISGVVLTEGHLRAMVSHNGIVGHQFHKAQEFTYPWRRGAMLVLHSDGLLSRWSLDASRGLTHRHPSVIAAVLHRDFARGRDDAGVVVVKERT